MLYCTVHNNTIYNQTMHKAARYLKFYISLHRFFLLSYFNSTYSAVDDLNDNTNVSLST